MGCVLNWQPKYKDISHGRFRIPLLGQIHIKNKSV